VQLAMVKFVLKLPRVAADDDGGVPRTVIKSDFGHWLTEGVLTCRLTRESGI
jgi:hypothetical protein